MDKLARGYSPENCRFASNRVQSRNRRNNRWITIVGETKILEDWATIFHITTSALHARLKRANGNIINALATPIRPREKAITYNGETKSITEWCKTTGLSFTTLSARLFKLGWDVEKALTTPADPTKSRVSKKQYTYQGETKTLKQLCDQYNLHYNTVRSRIQRGWTIEDAIELPTGIGKSIQIRHSMDKRNNLRTMSKTIGAQV